MNRRPDRNDPFAPPKKVVKVRCIHCDETYLSSEIVWNAHDELWVCKNYLFCAGAGFGFDIHEIENSESDT